MAKNSALPRESIAEQIAARLPTLEPQRDPVARALGERLLLDIAGLCVAARNADYVRAAIAAVEQPGPCTVIGEAAGLTLGAEGAAFVNGTAAHGEDFDDTYEGGPVHAGAVIVPALLAAAERHRLDGAELLRGIAIGCELMCRLCRVAPMRVHKAGFHPTAVFGAFGATAGIGAALRLTPAQQVDAFGIAGSLASGIIEYLAEGSWTKRLHAGLGGAERLSRGAAGEGRLQGSAHGLRGRARHVPWLRQHRRRQFRGDARRLRRASGAG